MDNQSLLPDNFSTALRLQNCRKALRYAHKDFECLTK
ncbi:hypothetical protein SAMN05216210_2139 [Halopseudomonas salegens]|uniref:Uncharacterized protein n=1 Tax=Halopseudomonas salegens TaxID=1434072 RepID=A0A1H2G9B6_9GAMM|nr:hypothetical protein SAMN05216210_2139 [Halopseudomonas salegens]